MLYLSSCVKISILSFCRQEDEQGCVWCVHEKLCFVSLLQSEKDLNGIVKDGNAAIRTLQHYVREQKEAAKGMKLNQVSRAAKAKGKK